MRYIEPDQPESEQVESSAREERLQKEIERLRRQLSEKEPHGSARTLKPQHPSSLSLWVITLGVTALIAVAFFAGYIPRQKRDTLVQAETRDQEQALPVVTIIDVGRSPSKTDLILPGNIQAVTEAPILARADGYVKSRMVDIGDRVKAGQPMAEIEAPELDQQVRQAKATLDQTQAAVEQATANREQAKTNTELARVTAQRWKDLAATGVVSRQDNDQYQAQYQAQLSNLQALDKAISAARGNVAAAEANLDRLNEVQGYRIVKAPFDGVVTLRNIDVGALIASGSTLLFRVAQTNVLRAYVNVPQTNAEAVRVGQPAQLTVSNLPGRRFFGTVARTANALDPASRTMLVELQVPNPDGALFPGMYANVDLSSPRANPPLLIPGNVLIVRADGTQVALLRPDNTVHFQKIEIGRDYGDRLEVTSGLKEGDRVIANASDDVQEGVKVNPAEPSEKPAAKAAGQ